MTRKRPSASLQAELLKIQENKCIYCDLEFNHVIKYKKKVIILKVHWDHLVPYSFLQDNPADNWVASCQICNGIKSNKMFDTFEELYIYVRKRHNKKLSSLPYIFQNKERKTNILQPNMPLESVGQKTPKNQIEILLNNYLKDCPTISYGFIKSCKFCDKCNTYFSTRFGWKKVCDECLTLPFRLNPDMR